MGQYIWHIGDMEVSMLFGVRAHDFGKLHVEELAQKISEKGFSHIQLALVKAIKGLDNDFGRLNPGWAGYVRDSFNKHNIRIAVLGCYINPIHPDIDERKKELSRFKEHIRFARDFGCSVVATETGSLNADFSFNPGNHGERAFETLLASVSELINEAEKFGVFVGIEGVESYVISSPYRMKRLIDAIGSNNLQVVFDPVNFLTVDNYENQDSLISEAFELFGDRIVAFHAKDFIIEAGRVKPVQVGKGILNYELILKNLKERKPYGSFLFEGIIPETAGESMNYLKDIYNRV